MQRKEEVIFSSLTNLLGVRLVSILMNSYSTAKKYGEYPLCLGEFDRKIYEDYYDVIKDQS